MRFFRNFHEREFEAAFLFLDLIQARILRGMGVIDPIGALMGMVSLILGPSIIGVHLLLASQGRGFGKSRCLRG